MNLSGHIHILYHAVANGPNSVRNNSFAIRIVDVWIGYLSDSANVSCVGLNI